MMYRAKIWQVEWCLRRLSFGYLILPICVHAYHPDQMEEVVNYKTSEASIILGYHDHIGHACRMETSESKHRSLIQNGVIGEYNGVFEINIIIEHIQRRNFY